MKEDMNTEFKELNRIDGSLPRTTAKEICAFANTDGGDIYFGIDDDGNAVGVKDTDDTMTRITNLINDEILPSVLPSTYIEVLNIYGKDVVKLSVSPGKDKPYYLRRFGLTPNGVYIRVGSSCHNISENAIRDMITASTGSSWEAQRCIRQDMTFDALMIALERNGIPKNEWTLKNLGLIGTDGLYNNAAWLISDQAERPIQVKVYADENLSKLCDAKEFSGSIISEVENVMAYLNLTNGERFEVVGSESRKVWDWTPQALREALMNSILHRDYSIRANNIILKTPKKIRFISCGALARDLSIDDIMSGATETRNPVIARIFRTLHYIEGFGFGVRKILIDAEENNSEALFRSTEARFYLDMSARNSKLGSTSKEEKDPPLGSSFMYAPRPEYRTIINEEDAVMDLIRDRKAISRKDVEMLLSVSQTKAYTVLENLREKGLIVQEKKGRSSFYRLP